MRKIIAGIRDCYGQYWRRIAVSEYSSFYEK